MRTHIRPALVSLLLLTVLTGVVYPLVVTGIAQLVVPAPGQRQPDRREDGKVVGSTLIGQPFDDPKYFWGRPSATSPFAYNARRLVAARTSARRTRRSTTRSRAASPRCAPPTRATRRRSRSTS